MSQHGQSKQTKAILQRDQHIDYDEDTSTHHERQLKGGLFFLVEIVSQHYASIYS